MKWTRGLIEGYIEYYDGLKNYQVLPWQVIEKIGGRAAVRGQRKFDSPFELPAIMNADFDMALDKIGKGKWTGLIDDLKFSDYKRFGRLQWVVIASIIGIEDYELEGLGFYRMPQMRGRAYGRMIRILNNLPIRNQLEAKRLTRCGII